MNKEMLKGDWERVKGKIKQQWGKFTDDELLQADGRYEELVGLIQSHYGKSKEEAHKELDKFFDSIYPS